MDVYKAVPGPTPMLLPSWPRFFGGGFHVANLFIYLCFKFNEFHYSYSGNQHHNLILQHFHPNPA